MNNIFTKGDFSKYKARDLLSLLVRTEQRNIDDDTGKVTVFISHKHDELEDLANIIVFLESEYNVSVYIDSEDPQMPDFPNEQTAKQIKKKIEKCKKFILLATDAAIRSIWCNWELGYGDAQKFKNNDIALIPLKKHGSAYTGNEYMQIYPHIVKREAGQSTYTNGKAVEAGYYVRTKTDDGTYNLTKLRDWFER